MCLYLVSLIYHVQLLAGGYVAPATEGVAAFSNLRVDPLEPFIVFPP